MKIYTFLFLTVALALFVVGCTQAPAPDPSGIQPEGPDARVAPCSDPRPEICTADYDPVCGDNGRTYSNRCSACADAAVTYAIPGECGSTAGAY